jgi:hypothetical protein
VWVLGLAGVKNEIKSNPDEGAVGARKIEKPRTPGIAGSRIGVSSATAAEEDAADVQNVLTELKAKAHSLAREGAVPTEQIRKEMLALTAEVSQPTWPGILQCNSWLQEGTTEELGSASARYGDERARRAAYSAAYELVFKRECLRLLQDPQTAPVTAAYFRWIASNFEKQFTKDPASFAGLLSHILNSEHGVYTGFDMHPVAFIDILDSAASVAASVETDRKITELGIPVAVTDFLEDRIRAQIFTAGLTMLESDQRAASR